MNKKVFWIIFAILAVILIIAAIRYNSAPQDRIDEGSQLSETTPSVIVDRICQEALTQYDISGRVDKCEDYYFAEADPSITADAGTQIYDLEGNFVMSCWGGRTLTSPECDRFASMTCTTARERCE